MIKMAVPVLSPNGLQSEITDHFGMAEDFVILETEGVEIKSFEILHNDPNVKGGKTPAKFLADIGVKIILSGYVGPHMLVILLNEGVRVFKGAVGTAEDAFEDYKAGMLTEVFKIEDMD
ncbi:hypothetical protein CUJ83_02135 [Methanocella sp. CWC-04]|uniref:Dinitrogenase iron-molybdenum cofactor biosynthesis domain-containing protein n=1 Tax=Methanooceanicella nereidis TaxID=2052831 RepID=A0AAP2RBZ1_9EURY|nr:NifB/NifX family molybdenum-iron cluster-binding protein [Methanocella sp. CWC-04]MCD1293795.1 hypothetical protein [Methanocella sp. CWC-04]